MKFIYSILICCMVWSLAAPNDPANFTLDNATTLNGDQPLAITSTLTKTGDTLTWTQVANGNTQTGSFSITAVSGSWDSSTSTGSLTYTMEVLNTPCTLELNGDSNGITATLTINYPDVEDDEFSFSASSINYQ